MKKNVFNRTHIEGIIYEHDLQLRVSGDNSKNPGTEFIMGNVHIATDDKMTNVIPVHFTYVTAVTSKGTSNATFGLLKDIIDGKLGNVMGDGVDKAAKLRIDSAIGLNEFYTDRNGEIELVSVKRNEGGFIHTTVALNEDEKERNTFDVDMLITGARRIDENPEREEAEKVIVSGYVFDFRKAILPVEFTAYNAGAMDYFEGLEATEKNPVFTHIRGRQISTTILKRIEEESAFGEPSVREVRNPRKEFVITWAQGTPYDWDDESTITAAEVKEAMENREIYLAGIKQRQDEYNATKGQAVKTTAPAKGAFNF